MSKTSSRSTLPNDPDHLEPILEACRDQGIDETWAVRETIRPPLHDPDGSGTAQPAVTREGGARESLRIGALPELTLVSSAAPQASAQGDLVLRRSIGEGGMGLVQLAFQTALEREVAIKRIRPDRRTYDTTEALLEEARLTGGLEHPNIIPVHALGRTHTGEPLMVMKRVEGASWEELIQDLNHPLWGAWEGDRVTRNIDITLSVCRALELAHDRGILHLDIKPENIMIGAFGEVYVMDWGVALELARIDELPPGQVVGTPAYMAPEMVMGRVNATPRTDVFLLGATLHEALTGEPRNTGETALSVMHAALFAEPFDYTDLEHIPDALADILNTACAREPEDRYPSIAGLRRALARFLEHRSAIQLTATSCDRLRELNALLEPTRSHDPAPLSADAKRRVQELFSAARFGFAQALSDVPDNARARDGLQETLGIGIDHELRNENLSAAEALLAALPTPSDTLAARVAALRSRLDVEGQARERLQEMEREMTFRGQNWKSSVGFILNGIAWLIALGGIGVLQQFDLLTLTPAINIACAGAVLLFHSTLIVLLRPLFLSTRIRRSFTMAVMVYVAAFLLNRFTGLLTDASVLHILMADFMALIVFLGIMASLIHRIVWWAALAATTCMFAAAALHEFAWHFAGLCGIACNLIFAWVVRPEDPLEAPSP